jgi:ribosome biogenesis GTPase
VAKDRGDYPQKRGRKVRVDLRKNRGKIARDKRDLTRRLHVGDESVEDLAREESVRPKGDLSRKRTIVIEEQGADRKDLRDGVVVSVRGLIAEVDDGVQRWACTIRRLLRTRLIEERVPITVGDQVRFLPDPSGESDGGVTIEGQVFPAAVIEDVQERETVLVREYERKRQVIAANVDAVVIAVAAARPPLRPHLIDRYIVSIHQGQMRPIVCINKADLDSTGAAAAVAETYRSLGYRAIMTSVPAGIGLDLLREVLRDQTSVLVGPSGVGKSSLINALAPELNLRIGSLTDLERGKHTTTTARLLRWPFGGYVVDTPGMRQFELPRVDAEELEAYFAEFVDLIRDCKFPGCSHVHEAGCAIRAAVEDGRITNQRYDSYCKMHAECEARPKY